MGGGSGDGILTGRGDFAKAQESEGLGDMVFGDTHVIDGMPISLVEVDGSLFDDLFRDSHWNELSEFTSEFASGDMTISSLMASYYRLKAMAGQYKPIKYCVVMTKEDWLKRRSEYWLSRHGRRFRGKYGRD